MKNSLRKPNHLKGQTSPYLLQHLYNPVDWYPWGKEALEKAQRENKPILVSIGYSACHWCHVMEKESFEDPEVAELMNREFVCIKVDREERPDIDHLYMTAVQFITRQGGWPLNCFALPDTRPFWGGTYFPKEQWKDILIQITELYRDRKDDLIDQAEQLTEGVASSGFIRFSREGISLEVSFGGQVFRNTMEYMDTAEGGTHRAPKFPLHVTLEFLLHYYFHTSDKSALAHVELSLEKMAMGGIYDQIGGGFARYSTDAVWKVPHFEKMLYDNAQLVSLCSNAWKVSGNPLFRDVVYQTVEFIKRELVSPAGTFYSALDADSEGKEGKFYVWKEKEIDEALGEDSGLVKAYYEVGNMGLWDNGTNILLRSKKDEIFARERNMSVGELNEFMNRAKRKLLEVRSARVRPGLDNKVITSWNALMIKGLADAYAAFGEGEFLHSAKRAADFILEHAVTSEGKVFRGLTNTSPSIDGFLEDYAMLIQALIRLFEVSMETGYLYKARLFTEYVTSNFSSSGTAMFLFSSNQGETLQAPYYEIYDGVIPSSNSVMALNLLHLSQYFENAGWAERSSQMLSDIRSRLSDQSISYMNWGRLLLSNIYPLFTLAVCGPEADQKLQEINGMYLPNVLLAGSISEIPGIPVLRNRFKEGETWYYVCSMGSCKMPVSELKFALEQMR